MNLPVAFRLDVGKHFRGSDVISTSVIHYIQIVRRCSIDRECHDAAVFQEPCGFGEQEMNFVNPGRHWILTVKGATPPSGEQLRIICSLDCMAGNREGMSPRAEAIFLPGKPAPVRIRCAIIPGHRTQGFSENTGWN